MARGSFQAQVLRVREDAIITAVNRLLAEKGFDAMTVDEVAAEVGIAKASLYKHFPSKEALAAAAMVRVLQRANEVSLAQPADASPLAKLEAVTRWALQVQLASDMPTLPSQNSSLRTELLQSRAYTDGLTELSDRLGEWIVQAQHSGALDSQLPPELVLFTLFARACDPVPGFLKLSGRYDDDRIVQLVLDTCFNGLRTRAS